MSGHTLINSIKFLLLSRHKGYREMPESEKEENLEALSK